MACANAADPSTWRPAVPPGDGQTWMSRHIRSCGRQSGKRRVGTKSSECFTRANLDVSSGNGSDWRFEARKSRISGRVLGLRGRTGRAERRRGSARAFLHSDIYFWHKGSSAVGGFRGTIGLLHGRRSAVRLDLFCGRLVLTRSTAAEIGGWSRRGAYVEEGPAVWSDRRWNDVCGRFRRVERPADGKPNDGEEAAAGTGRGSGERDADKIRSQWAEVVRRPTARQKPHTTSVSIWFKRRNVCSRTRKRKRGS